MQDRVKVKLSEMGLIYKPIKMKWIMQKQHFKLYLEELKCLGL